MPQQEADKLKKPYPVRFAPAELEEVRDKAELAGLPIGTYIREAALQHRVVGRSRQQLISELSRLGGLQKHLFTEGGGYKGSVLGTAYRAILLEITEAIRRIERSTE